MNFPKNAKNSRADWLKSLVKGDKVVVCYPFYLKDLHEPSNIESAFREETFEGFSLKEPGQKMWIACEYDGGFLISAKDIYPTKKAAQNANASKIIAAIKKKRRKLFDESAKWLKLQQEYQNMLPNTDPIVEKASFAKLPKTWGTMNGQKF